HDQGRRLVHGRDVGQAERVGGAGLRQSRRDGGRGGLRRETHSELEGRVARTEEEDKGRPTQEVSTGPWCRWARLFLEAHPGTVKTFVGVLLRCLLGTCFGARLRGLLVKDGGRFQQSRFDRGS